jgi:hypothetical protein
MSFGRLLVLASSLSTLWASATLDKQTIINSVPKTRHRQLLVCIGFMFPPSIASALV